MVSPFQNSVFFELITRKRNQNFGPMAIMGGISGSTFSDPEKLSDLPYVIFDFETTGLDTRTARIIEIGAIKYVNRQETERFSALVSPGEKLRPEIVSITGIDDEMLVGQPTIDEVLPAFHDFLRGCLGVAHNAEFDCGILVHESARLGFQCDYHVVCTLKMARALVASERKNLDALAAHYNLTFESRHRSIGDILVTAEVLWHMLDENPSLATIKDLRPYQEVMVEI